MEEEAEEMEDAINNNFYPGSKSNLDLFNLFNFILLLIFNNYKLHFGANIVGPYFS